MLIFKCEECGSTSVQSKCWADPNTDEIIDYVGEDIQDNWCDTCQRHVTLETITTD